MTLRKILWAGLIVAAAIVGYRWFQRAPAPANFPPGASGPWVAFGDSLTEGQGASAGNDYPTLLSRSLGVPILNLGVSGDTTAGGLARLGSLLEKRPRVVLLCLGGNDGLNQVPRAEMIANLGTILDRLQAAGSFVVLIGIRSPSLRDHNEEHFARLAREKRAFYVPDLLRGVAFKPVYMADAIHPNDEGYRQIAARLDKALRPLLPKLRDPSAAP